MKKKEISNLSPEYDFSKGVRGKYAKKFTEGSNIILLAPDVYKNFSDSDTVNETLRVLTKIALRKKKKVLS